jgi:hypothetical protein
VDPLVARQHDSYYGCSSTGAAGGGMAEAGVGVPLPGEGTPLALPPAESPQGEGAGESQPEPALDASSIALDLVSGEESAEGAGEGCETPRGLKRKSLPREGPAARKTVGQKEEEAMAACAGTSGFRVGCYYRLPICSMSRF